MRGGLLKAALVTAVMGLAASVAYAQSSNGKGTQNPYSPQAGGHEYRHGAVPTRETKAAMDRWNQEFYHNGAAFAACMHTVQSDVLQHPLYICHAIGYKPRC